MRIGEKEIALEKVISCAEARAKIARSRQRTFRIKSPSGEIITGVNLKKFCRDNGLNHGAVFSVFAGRVNHHKGWTKP